MIGTRVSVVAVLVEVDPSTVVTVEAMSESEAESVSGVEDVLDPRVAVIVENTPLLIGA